MSLVWHDLECGPYDADLSVWRVLAERHGGPVLDVGAGAGRISLDLARQGHAVTALDIDAELLAALRRRADGLPIETVQADARRFELARQYPLAIVPMQTVQLLGGAAGRAEFLGRVRAHLTADGVLAAAIADALECFDERDGGPSPLPDVCEREGIVYCSRPVAVRRDGDGFVLERRREIVSAAGEHAVEHDVVRLDAVTATELEREARATGFKLVAQMGVPSTRDYVGSTVVVLGA